MKTLRIYQLWVVMVVTVATRLVTSYATSTTVRKTVPLREDSQPGTVVEELAHVLNMRMSHVPRKNFQQLSQNLLKSSQSTEDTKHVTWLSLNQATGRITLSRPVDREQLCGHSNKCTIRMQIYVHSSSRMVYLDVPIVDVNEHAPEFPFRYLSINISEDARVDDIIPLDRYLAVDQDSGNNSKVTHTLNANSHFNLGQYTDETGSTHLHLEVLKELDYEKKQLYRLTLSATDHGEPPLTSHVPLQIRITDVNDNEPVFNQKEYSVVIKEDTPPAHVVARVQATDRDSGKAGTVRYSIGGRNKEKIRRLFSINERTGEVTLLGNLDREKFNRLVVYIEAHDQDPVNQKVGRCRLIIHVTDVNDNKPSIIVNYIATAIENTVYISEASPMKTFFAYVSAKDSDLEANGEVETQIETFIPAHRDEEDTTRSEAGVSDPQSSFVLNDDGFLGVGRRLDREEQPSYIIRITACDHGISRQCTNFDITVVLLDENDNTPMFQHKVYNITMPENAAVGSSVTTIIATDQDRTNHPALRLNNENQITASTNGDVVYSISGGDGTFSIDPKSGKITLVRSLDREQVNKWKIFVNARDRGQPVALTSRCVLMVKVKDVNDNAPVFTNPSNDETTIFATILRDDVLTRIQAVDYDEQSDIKYRLLSEDGVKQKKLNSTLFVINSHTGDLRLNMSHRNLKSSLGMHTIVIQARDNGNPAMQSIRTLKVMVTASKTLPKVLSNGQEENSWSGSSLVIIIAALSSAMVLLIVVVIIIVVRCKRENKAVRTYECKGKQSDTNRHDQFCEIKGTNHRKNLSVDSNQVIWKPALNVRRPSTNYDSNSEVTSLSHNMASTAQHYAAPTIAGPTPCVAPYHTEKNLVPTSTASHSSAQSHHDVDSGRGDSDQDLGVSDVTFDRGYVPARNEIQQTNVSASRCNEQCLLYGHSDACWMPMVEQEPEFKQRSIYPTTSSPYEKHTASQQYMSSCLEPIPEKSQIQSDWSQMDSDSNLSSIYSNVQPSHRRDDYIKIAGGRNISPSFRIDLTNSITQGYKTELL